MIARATRPSRARLLTLSLAALAAILLSACGSAAKSKAHSSSLIAEEQGSTGMPAGCAATVMKTLGRIVERVYHEGVRSQRTGSANYLMMSSTALRAAVESDSAAAARAAAKTLLATGHLTNVRVSVGSQLLINAGKPALTPLRGTITSAAGAPIASYITSVWSDVGFMAEVGGVVEGYVALREGKRLLPGSFPLPSASLPNEGTVTRAGIVYQYTSFSGEAFPAGAVRIYMLRPLSTTRPLCEYSGKDTIVNTLRHVAHLIYEEESGPPAQRQIARVQGNRALLEAVAQRNPAATFAAVRTLLHEHIVRLRVLGRDGELLADDGGPYVLAPLRAPLRLHGRRIGSIVLSVQDDEGYEKLAKRLEGLDVVIYMGSKIVKDSLGPVSGEIPESGSYTYHRHGFRVFTVHAKAFPSGPLVIRVLVPLPYFSVPLS